MNIRRLQRPRVWRLGVVVLGLLLIGAVPAGGALVLEVGSATVEAGQFVTIDVTITSSEPAASLGIEGFDLAVQLGDGKGLTPAITLLDLTTNTVLSGVANFVLTPAGGLEPQFQARNVFTEVPGTVIPPDGLLASITIDTTGAALGTYPIRLFNTESPGSQTTLYNGAGEIVPATLGVGELVVDIPEPGGLLLLAGAAPLAMRRRRG